MMKGGRKQRGTERSIQTGLSCLSGGYSFVMGLELHATEQVGDCSACRGVQRDQQGVCVCVD